MTFATMFAQVGSPPFGPVSPASDPMAMLNNIWVQMLIVAVVAYVIGWMIRNKGLGLGFSPVKSEGAPAATHAAISVVGTKVSEQLRDLPAQHPAFQIVDMALKNPQFSKPLMEVAVGMVDKTPRS